MVAQRIRQTFNPSGFPFQIIVGCGLGVVLGLLCLWFSPLIAVGAVGAVFFLYAALKRPEIGLLGILVATSSIIFEDQLPLLSFGGMSLHVPDLILLLLLTLILVRWLVEPGFKLAHTPLDLPLLIFYGVTLLSTIIAILQSSVEMVEARRMIRVLSYYLTFFVVTNLVRERRQLNLLTNGLFLLATVVGAAMIVQFLLGSTMQLLPGRVESLWTQGTTYGDITRIMPPGFSVLLVSFAGLLGVLVAQEFKLSGILKFFQWSLLGLALVVTFLRSYWAALIIVIFVLAFILRGQNWRRFSGVSVVVLFLVGMALSIVYSDPESRAAGLVSASVERGSTLVQSATFQGQDSSFDWRVLEVRYAIPAIAAHPLIGLGLSAKWRPYDRRLDVPGSGYDFRKYVHSGYLYILLDMGLLGLGAFMWLSIVFLVRGFRNWQSVADTQFRGVVLGFTLAYLVVLVAAVANLTLVEWRWTPVLGIMMGISEVILLRFGQVETLCE